MTMIAHITRSLDGESVSCKITVPHDDELRFIEFLSKVKFVKNDYNVWISTNAITHVQFRKENDENE